MGTSHSQIECKETRILPRPTSDRSIKLSPQPSPQPQPSPSNNNQVVWNDFQNMMSEYNNLTQQSEIQKNKDIFVQENYDKISLCELQKHISFLNNEIDNLKTQREKIKKKTLDNKHIEMIVMNIVEFIDKSWMYNPITSDSREQYENSKLKESITMGIQSIKNSILDDLE